MENNNEFKSINELESLDDLELEYNETFFVEGGLNMIENEYKYLLDNHRKWLNKAGGQKLSVNSMDFSNKKFVDENLQKATFENCDMSYTNFQKIDFSEAVFSKCNLEGTSFDNCRFHEAKFIDCKFNKSIIVNNVGLRLEIKSSELKNVTFVSNQFEAMSFETCTVKKTSLLSNFMRKSFIYDSEFYDTKFSDSDLTESNINTCEFTDCDFRGINFDSSIIKNNIMVKNEIISSIFTNISGIEVYSMQIPIRDKSYLIQNIPEWDLWTFENTCGSIVDLYKYWEDRYYFDDTKDKLEDIVYLISNMKNKGNQNTKMEEDKVFDWE